MGGKEHVLWVAQDPRYPAGAMMLRVPEGSYVSDVVRECSGLFTFNGKQAPPGGLVLTTAEGAPLDNRRPVIEVLPGPSEEDGVSTTSQPPIFIVQAAPRHDFRRYYESHHPGLVTALPYLLNSAYKSRHDDLWNALQMREMYSKCGTVTGPDSERKMSLLTFDTVPEVGGASDTPVCGSPMAAKRDKTLLGKKEMSLSNLSISIEEASQKEKPRRRGHHGRTQSSGKESYFSEQSERSVNSPKGKQMHDSVHTGHSSHEVDDIDTSSSSGEAAQDVGASTYDMKRNLHRLTNAGAKGNSSIKNLLDAVGAVSMTDDNLVKLSPRIDMDNPHRPYTPREYHAKKEEKKIKKRQSLPAGHPIPHVTSSFEDKKSATGKEKRTRAQSNCVNTNEDIRSLLNSSGTLPEGRRNSPTSETLATDREEKQALSHSVSQKGVTCAGQHEDIRSLLSTTGTLPEGAAGAARRSTPSSPVPADESPSGSTAKPDSTPDRWVRVLESKQDDSPRQPDSCTEGPEPTEPMSTQQEYHSPHPLRPRAEDLRLALDCIGARKSPDPPADVKSPDVASLLLDGSGVKQTHSLSIHGSPLDTSSKAATTATTTTTTTETTSGGNSFEIRSPTTNSPQTDNSHIHDMLASMGARKDSGGLDTSSSSPAPAVSPPRSSGGAAPGTAPSPPAASPAKAAKIPAIPPLNFNQLPGQATRPAPAQLPKVVIEPSPQQVPAVVEAPKKPTPAPEPVKAPEPEPEPEEPAALVPKPPGKPAAEQLFDAEDATNELAKMGIPMGILAALANCSGDGTQRMSMKQSGTITLGDMQSLAPLLGTMK